MLWAVLAILTAVIYSIVVLVDKVVMEKWIKHPMIPLLSLSLVGMLASVVVFLTKGFAKLSTFNTVLAVLSGALVVGGGYFYYKAIQIEEASRVAPLFSLSPLLVLIFAAIFLGEVLTFARYVGIVLLVVGAVTVSTRSIRLKLNKAFGYMMITLSTGTVSVVIGKYLLGFIGYWDVFAYMRAGAFLATIPAFFIYLPKLMTTLRKHGKVILVPMVISQMGSLGAMVLQTAAMAMASVTLVVSLTATQPFFILVFSVILSVFFPKILKEKITRPILIQKALAIVLMFIGALLIL